MIRLYDGDTEAEVGRISEAQLEIMTENLVEETIDEYGYNISPGVIDSLEASGADPELVAMLRKALGSRTSMELRYEFE
ncbi:MAG TPA: galactosyldiacylglycerol synthase [Candidatus Polarisedimenticolia bacterium]|nr:galactosyldiacylglycerol synthase [Candidatus Polarisedimenticolia bacterium]